MVFVTGGTGFVGAHVVRALLARGERVRCLVRPGSGRAALAGQDVELVEGDLGDPVLLRRALAGCRTLFHCAADYRLHVPDPEAMYRSNVEGTDNVLGAAAESGVDRVVYTSSVATLCGSADHVPATESTAAALDDMVGPYKRSKFLAERAALAWHARGLPVVIVNPSTPIGELDVKPTPTGRLLVDFLNRQMPAYVSTGLNLIDVRDVAAGHLAAAERGRPGERYILGHRNMTLRELLVALGRVARLPAPRLRLPHFVPLALAALEAPWARLRGRPPRIPLDGVRMSRRTMYVDSAKAVGELGLPQSGVEEALGRAVAWFRAQGYARS
jgi:dihydroflavonol-4-reductase